MMKKILVTPRLETKDTYTETRECLDVRWGSLMNKIGFFPFPVSYEMPPEAYFNSPPSGLILTGGNDLFEVNDNPLSAQRDSYENRLLDLAIEHDIPVLGVCRGCQLMAVRHGVKMHPIAGHVAMRIKVHKQVAGRFISPDFEEINSYHHYGFSQIPSDFISIYLSEDGIIKAMEHLHLPLAGIMWHPEREDPFSHFRP